MTYHNGSTVLRTDIGEEAAALQCTTDKVTCCTNQNGEIRDGEFYFPDGTPVPVAGATISSYYRTRGSMMIALNHRSNIITQPTGQFRCEIPDASGTTVNLFINIGRLMNSRKIIYFVNVSVSHVVDEIPTNTTTEAAVSISLSITASGTNTAGQTYRLECSATVTGSTDQPTFTWLDPMNNPVPSVMVTTTGSMNTLTLSPLAVSHAGTYTCRVTAGGVTETQTTTVVVKGMFVVCTCTLLPYLLE